MLTPVADAMPDAGLRGWHPRESVRTGGAAAHGEDTLSNRYPGRNGGRDSSIPFPGPPERGAAMNRSASDRIQRE